jgi:mannose-6-phosphate isomerase-like protein (cupin superfamily)
MIKEIIYSKRSTLLRKNDSRVLSLEITFNKFQDVFILNGNSFLIEENSNQVLTIRPENYYSVINNGDSPIEIQYSQDVSQHKIIYDPYKYEHSKKINLKSEFFIEKYNVPKSYTDTLPKWYSFKFTYPDYNLIFVRPEMGISIQTHEHRNEYWEILEGNPIIITGNKVHYFVENGTKFKNQRNSFHSVINPNKEADKFVMLKERWDGKFDEKDISRVFNPNHYR